MTHLTPKPWQLRAMLDGTVSCVVVPMKPQPTPWKDYHLEGGCQVSDWSFEIGPYTEDGKHFQTGLWMHCRFHESRFQALPLPLGKPVWVREAYIAGKAVGGYAPGVDPDADPDGPTVDVIYRASHDGSGVDRWSSPATMPRWASRLTLVASEARVCRVQDVTEDEAYRAGIDEERCCGVPTDSCGTHLGGCCGQPLVVDLIDAFREQWTADHGPDSWSANPWVQIARVAVHHCNIDKIKAEEDAA